MSSNFQRHWDRCGCWDIRECQGKWGPVQGTALSHREGH